MPRNLRQWVAGGRSRAVRDVRRPKPGPGQPGTRLEGVQSAQATGAESVSELAALMGVCRTIDDDADDEVSVWILTP
jgi:hypothetical protein